MERIGGRNSRRTVFRVHRFDPDVDTAPRFDEFALDVPEGMTVLEALLRIQAEQDGSLAFRYACRGAICGSCSMVIEGRIGLACRLQVQDLGVDRVTLEPLPHLRPVKDLLVDMEPFFDAVNAVQPWLQPQETAPERERLVRTEEWSEAEPYTHCILCASCQAVCPAVERDPAYLGPAALARHYRFLADVRDTADDARLALVDSEQGVWGCDMVWNCVNICPKGVPPTRGIGKSRVRIRRAQRAASED